MYYLWPSLHRKVWVDPAAWFASYLAEEGISWPCCLYYLWPSWPRKIWVDPAAWITCNLSDRGRYELTLLLDLPVTYLAEGGMSSPCSLTFLLPSLHRKVWVDPAACITCNLAGTGRYELTLLLDLPVTYLTEGGMSWPCSLTYLFPFWQREV